MKLQIEKSIFNEVVRLFTIWRKEFWQQQQKTEVALDLGSSTNAGCLMS
jgi:hypothetical protein